LPNRQSQNTWLQRIFANDSVAEASNRITSFNFLLSLPSPAAIDPRVHTLNSFRYSAIVSALVLLVLATGLKFAPWIPNVALFGALSVFCGAYLRGPLAWIIPIGGIIASDFLGELLGVAGIYRYTAISMVLNYVGFAAMVGVGHVLRLKDSWDIVLGTSIVGSIAFFIVSNFGCWLDPVMKYSTSLTGLVDCYVSAIPFFKNSFLSDVIGTTAVVAVHQVAMTYQTSEVSETV
jgi:hypothetical protein